MQGKLKILIGVACTTDQDRNKSWNSKDQNKYSGNASFRRQDASFNIRNIPSLLPTSPYKTEMSGSEISRFSTASSDSVPCSSAAYAPGLKILLRERKHPYDYRATEPHSAAKEEAIRSLQEQITKLKESYGKLQEEQQDKYFARERESQETIVGLREEIASLKKAYETMSKQQGDTHKLEAQLQYSTAQIGHKDEEINKLNKTISSNMQYKETSTLYEDGIKQIYDQVRIILLERCVEKSRIPSRRDDACESIIEDTLSMLDMLSERIRKLTHANQELQNGNSAIPSTYSVEIDAVRRAEEKVGREKECLEEKIINLKADRHAALHKLTTEHDKLKANIQDNESKMEQMRITIETLEQQNQIMLRTETQKQTDIDSLQHQLETSLSKVNESEATVTHLSKGIEGKKHEMDKLQHIIAEYERKNNELETKKKKVPTATLR